MRPNRSRLLITTDIDIDECGCGRDLSSWEHTTTKTLTSLCSLSSHTRPISCIDGHALSARSAVLYTADTMGAIKVWDVELEDGWRARLREELGHHRTGINEMVYGNGQLWTGELLSRPV